MSRVTTSTSSTSDSTKKVNVKLNAVQKKQFDIIAELKPEWTVDDIYQFCQRHEFDSDKLQSSLDSTFEFDNTQTDDNWMSIQKKPSSKQSVNDSKSTQSTSGGPKQKFDRTQRPDRANKPPRTGKPAQAAAAAAAVTPAGGADATGDVEESKVAEADGHGSGEKKPYVKRERKPFNKDRPAGGADGAQQQQPRRPYNRDGQQQQSQQRDQRPTKGGKREQQQQPAEPSVPLPKPGISFLSALNTGLTKPKAAAPAVAPAQSSPPAAQQQQQPPSADQTQAVEPATQQSEHKEEQKPAAVDTRRQKELEQKAHEDSILAKRMAAVPQPRGVWKKRTPQEIEAEQAAQREAEQQRQQAEAAAQQQHQPEPAVEEQQQPQEEEQQQVDEPADAEQAYEPEQQQLDEQFDQLHVQQPLSPQPQEQQYSAEPAIPHGQLSPEPTTVPQPLAHQPLPVSSAFSSSVPPSIQPPQAAQQSQSHSIFGSYQPGIRSVNELLSQNDPVVLPRHIQTATQQSYPNISFGAFNLGNRQQPKDLSAPQQPPTTAQSVSPQPAQKSASPAPPPQQQQPPTSYAAATTQQQPPAQQAQQPTPPSASRFGAGISSALSPLLPSSAAESAKQPSAEPHQPLDYAGGVDTAGDQAQNVYNQYDEPQHGYQAHYPTQYGQQQYDQPSNYYAAQSHYAQQPQFEDSTYGGGYNDQYRPKSGNKPNANVNKQPIGPNARSQQPGGKPPGQQPQGQQYRPQQQQQYDQYGGQQGGGGKQQSYQQRQQGGPQGGYQQPQQYAPVNKPAQPAVGQPSYNANKSGGGFNKPGPQQQAYPQTAPYQYNQPAPYNTPLYSYNQQPMYSPYSQYSQYPAQVPPGFRQQQPYYPTQPYQPQPYQSQYPPQQYASDDQQQQAYGSPNSAAGQPHAGNEYSKQSPESGSSSGRNTGAPQDTGAAGGYEPQAWHKEQQAGQHQQQPAYQPAYGAPQQAYNQYGQQQQGYGRQQYGGDHQQQQQQYGRPAGQWPQSQQ